MGDAFAFSEIYRRHFVHAERVARRYLQSPDDVKDAAQEAMTRAFTALPRFNGDYALRAWVEKITMNLCLDILRSRSRRSPNGAEVNLEETLEKEVAIHPVDHRFDPIEHAEGLFQAKEIRECLDRMAHHHRAAIVLREVEGRTHAEIAGILGISGSQAKALIHRAKHTFRRLWRAQENRTPVALLAIVPSKPSGMLRRTVHQTGGIVGTASSSQVPFAPAFAQSIC